MGLNDFESGLREWFSGFERAVVIGIGNPLRRDDFVGVEIVKWLKERVQKNEVLFLESETVPESYIELIVKFDPSHILIIDAALMGLESGDMVLTDYLALTGVAVSTHALPIKIFCSFLLRVTGAKISLLLIQPGEVDFGEGLSAGLRGSLERVVNLLASILH
jgi:hydrogenase 3 maturation protease